MIYFTCVSVVCTAAAGHKMVVEGWALFEEAVNQAGAGDLPQLLWSIRTMTTPPPLTTPPPAAQMDITAMTPGPSPVKKGVGEAGEDLVFMKVGGKYQYGCPRCDKVTTSKHSCDAHICQVHIGKIPMCAYCRFSMYTMDSLNSHMRGHS